MVILTIFQTQNIITDITRRVVNQFIDKIFIYENKNIEIKLKYKEFSGTFSIVYEDENEILNFIIGQNINANAEIVKKVYDNEVNSMVNLNSGIKFKILA